MNEREWDKRLRIRTIGREDESDANYSPYEPTPYAVLQRLADSGVVRRRHHLLDYGCGKGRVAFFLAEVIGCRVTGIDKSRKLIDIAMENRRSARAGDRVRLSCCFAEQYEIRDEDVFFFFNPFSEKVFGCALRQIVSAWYDHPRELIVICYYPSAAYARCLEETPELHLTEEIDCNDLFNGRMNPCERIIVYRTKAGPGQ